MNKIDIQELSVHKKADSLSLFIHFPSSLTLYERVQFFNRMIQKAQLLLQQSHPHIPQSLIPELYVLQSQIDIENKNCESIALFINEEIVQIYALSFPIPPNIYIRDTFITDPITAILNRLERYWILMLYKNTPYLFEGHEQKIMEVRHRHITKNGEELYAAQDLAGSICALPLSNWGPHCRYASKNEFIATIDLYISHFINADPLPIAYIATSTDLDALSQYSKYGSNAIIIKNDHNQLFSPQELIETVAPLMQDHYIKKRNWALTLMTKKKEFLITHPEKILPLIMQDQIECIAIEKSYHVTTEITDQDALDLTDHIIQQALNKKIPAIIFPDKTLQKGIIGVPVIIKNQFKKEI